MLTSLLFVVRSHNIEMLVISATREEVDVPEKQPPRDDNTRRPREATPTCVMTTPNGELLCILQGVQVRKSGPFYNQQGQILLPVLFLDVSRKNFN